MGYLPKVFFFNAFELGTQIKSKYRTKQRSKTKETIFCFFQIISESKEVIKTK
jgi:hypothetical protein